MAQTVHRMAQGMFAGSLIAYIALWLLGMPDEARHVLALMWLSTGIQLGALWYGRKHGEEI